MKIEIEFHSSTNASLVIDGKKLTVDRKPGHVECNGFPENCHNSFADMVATELMSLISGIMQAEAAAADVDSPGDPLDHWKPLSDEACEAAADKF